MRIQDFPIFYKEDKARNPASGISVHKYKTNILRILKASGVYYLVHRALSLSHVDVFGIRGL